MPTYDQDHVVLVDGIVVWDEVSNPVIQTQGSNAGKPKWTLKAVFPPGHPDVMLLDQLAQRCLQESEFRGTLPAGGFMPIKTLDHTRYDGMFPGWSIIKFTTQFEPEIWIGGKVVQKMQYVPVLYAGQKVSIIASCHAYNNVSKGIGAGLASMEILVAQNAPRLQFSTGKGVDASRAFGGGGQQQQQPAYGQQQQQPVYGQQQPVYGQQQQQQQPPVYGQQQSQPVYGQQQQQQPVYGQQQQQQPVYGQQQQQQQQPVYGQQQSQPVYGQQQHEYLPPKY